MGCTTLLGLLALSTLALCVTADDVLTLPVTPTESYSHWASMDEEARYILFWKFDTETITFEVHAQTLGWVGMGLSSNGAMLGSDIVIGWVKDGQPYFKDRHGIGNEMPLVDVTQDYELLDAREDGGYTMLKFRRQLETCDEDDMAVDDGTARVLFSWGDLDPENEDQIQQHVVRGSKSILLVDYTKASDETVAEGNDMASFDLVVNNGRVGKGRTTYWCRTQALPQFDTKVHVVKVEPLIRKETMGVVHHIVAYLCHGHMQTQDEGNVCWEGNMPENATACDTILYGWAVGQGTFHWPSEAGMPLGEEGGARFVNIEMHYDNPEGLEGVVDNSGLRIFYTPELRKYDSGVLLLGHALWWPKMVIPPKADNFRIDSYCTKECTKTLPEEGINAFAVLLHTHLVGTGIYTKVVRNGTELEELARDDHYDFNFQEVRRRKELYKILPGDDLITSCLYNTRGRTNMTEGGSGTDNEMCFNFVMYYPRTSLQSCLSLNQPYYVTHQWIMQKAMAGEIDVDPTKDDQDTYDIMNQLKWSEDEISTLQSHMDGAHGFRQMCSHSRSGFGAFGGASSTYHERFVIEKPYKKEGKCAPLDDGIDFVSSAPGQWREPGLLLLGLLALALNTIA